MQNTKRFLLVVLLLLAFVSKVSFAEEDPLPISHLNVVASVDVPENCSVTDIDGVPHDYPKGESYLAICALSKAIENSSISSVKFSNQYPELGLFVTGINEVSADPNSQYWALYKNGTFADLGLTSLPVDAGDIIMLQLHDFSDNNLEDQITININSLITPAPINTGGGGSGGHRSSGSVLGITTEKTEFDLEKAYQFLISQQKEDGSFGEDIYTDWIAMSLASSNHLQEVIKLIKYFEEYKLDEKSSLTDYERHTIALMSLGLNPYNTNGENYIKKITDNFDGKQFGDIDEDNDDIFALIVLQNAGFNSDDKNITSSIDFVLSKQKENGSFDESIDMTGASIEALSGFNQNEKIKNALLKAKDFLKKNQKEDGGFGNVSSTSWAIEGILALGEKPEDWKIEDPANEASNTPFDYLALKQDTDGGIKGENTENRIWQTSYAIKAYSGKKWNDVMQKFKKPEIIPTVVATPEVPKKKIAVNKLLTATSIKSIETSKVENISPIPPVIPKSELKKSWFSKILGFLFS